MAGKHSPPPKPPIAPRIGHQYSSDKDGDRIADALKEKSDAAQKEQAPGRLMEIELVFTEPVTQEQLDAFENAGGEIEHVYQTISYGWNGRCPLSLVPRLPKLLGPTLILAEEAPEMKLNMLNATQTGRVRPIWANNFAGSSVGYSGSANVTIGIIDTGVDDSHTDLAGRRVWWKDYANTTSNTPVDYYGHGTHIAGIALGSGAASGTNTSAFNFTLWNTLANASAGASYQSMVFALPAASLTWSEGAQWSGGAQTTIYENYRAAGTPAGTSLSTQTSGTGGSPLAISATFTPSSSRVYLSRIIQSLITANGVTDYALTNTISNYPAVGDGFAKFRGVAPSCKLAAAKVTTGTGMTISSTYVNSALDDMTTGRQTNKIKVINCSFGASGSPGLNTTQRQYVNNAAANGIVMVVAAGNDGAAGTASEREIDDPGRAAYAITVGANNATNQLCDYSSQGFVSPGSSLGQEEDYKPDVLAPGGSTYYGAIFSTDSNSQDGNLADVKANDYTPDIGTSMSAPFVAGCAGLIISAMEQAGHAWDFTSSTDPMYVKMLLSATATEGNANRESGTNNPTLQRARTDGTGFPAGKDQYEGYGVINPDAAIEAAVLSFTNNTTLTNGFGGLATDRRAWARKIVANGGQTITLTLTNPAAGDFDLYLYSAAPSTYGRPILLASSTSSTTGANESLSYTPTANLETFVVVKRVSGSGTFNIRFSTTSNDAFASAWTLSGGSGTGSGNNTGYTTETSEPTFGQTGERKTAWYKWTAPFSGSASFSVDNNHILRLFYGSTLASLTEPATTHLQAGDISSESYYVTAGNTYRLAVDSTTGNSGQFSVTYLYDSIVSATFTNTQAIITSGSGSAAPYPSTITVPSLAGNLTKVTVTLVNFTNYSQPDMDVILVSPNNTVTYLLSDVGGSGASGGFSTLVFSDSATASLSAGTMITSGTYKPSNASSGDSFPSPVPTGTYYTNLSVFNNQSVAGAWLLYVVDDSSDIPFAGGILGGWTLSLTMDQFPTFYDFGNANINYTENGTPVKLITSPFLQDNDNADFKGGSVTAAFTANGASEDRLVLVNEGTSAGQIGVSGSVVSYGGTNIGYYTGGTNGTASLVVTLTNTAASLAAVQQLTTRIAYTNISDNPSTATRSVQVTVDDGLGGTSSVAKTATVIAVNDAPVLTSISTLTNATEDTAFSVSYTTLRAAATVSDVDSSAISFRIESYTGVLTKNGTNVVTGSTLVSSNESVIWTPPANTNGSAVNAFTVRAWDGTLASSSAVQVSVNVTAVNDAPVLANAMGNQATTYGAAFSYTFPTNTFTDVESSTLTYTATGLPPGISLTSASRQISGTVGASGSYSARLIATDDGGLSATNSFTFSVSKATITASASSAIRTYGAANPTFSSTLTGVVNGDPITLSLNCAATSSSSPGTYPIAISLNDPNSRLTNYTATTTNGTLTVGKAFLSVTPNATSRAYGATNPVFTASYSGFVNSESLGTSDITGAPSISTTASTNSSVGNYTLNFNTGTLNSSNYGFYGFNGALTVTNAPLTLTSSNASRVFGAANPAFGGSLSGLQNNDNITASYSTTATTSSPVGSYPISAMLLDPDSRLGNYTATTNLGTLTVSQATLTVTPTATSRVYGATNPVFTASYSGFVNGESLGTSDVTGTPSITTIASTNSTVGYFILNIEVGTLNSANYAFQLFGNRLTVTNALLTVTSSNASRVFGAANPVFGGFISGLQNNDNITANYNTTATASSPVGTYPISVTLLDPDSRLRNYTVTTNLGTLTVLENSLPIVGFLTPDPSSSIQAGGTTLLTAFASDADGSIAKVEFYEGDNLLALTTNTPYSALWTNTFAGNFTLSVVGTDNHNTSTTNSIMVVVNPSITSTLVATNFCLLFHGVQNISYVAEYSSDLTTWFTLTNFTITTAPAQITDLLDSSQRFYRIQESNR